MAKSSSNKSEAFERFHAFAKQVTAVPKTEIDRRESEYQKARKANRKAKA